MKHATVAVLVLGAFSQALAGSLTFNDPDSGLRIDRPMAGASVCYLKPVELGYPGDCEGLDVGAVAGRVPPEASLVAIVRQGDWAFSVALMDHARPQGPVSKAKARDYIRGAKRQATGFKVERDEPDFDVINGLRVFSFTAVSSDRELPFNTMIQYVVIGDRTLSIFSFGADEEHLPVLKRQAAELMKAVKGPGLSGAVRWSEGSEDSAPHDPYFEAGKAFGALLANVFCLAVICVGAVLVYRSFRRRRAPRGPSA